MTFSKKHGNVTKQNANKTITTHITLKYLKVIKFYFANKLLNPKEEQNPNQMILTTFLFSLI